MLETSLVRELTFKLRTGRFPAKEELEKGGLSESRLRELIEVDSHFRILKVLRFKIRYEEDDLALLAERL